MVKQNQNSSCENVKRFLAGSTLGNVLKPIYCQDFEPVSLLHRVLSIAQEWSQGSQLGDVLEAAVALFEDNGNNNSEEAKIIKPEGTVRT